MRSHSYLNTALSLLDSYDGSLPLQHHLKQYFSQHKKHGSKDRKYIAHLCYCFFRLGNALRNIFNEERIKIALFLCSDNPGIFSGLFDATWLEQWQNDIAGRIQFIQTTYPSFNVKDIFILHDELSEGVDASLFSTSHLTQPDVFIRIRPNKKNIVQTKLNEANVAYTLLSDDCIALPNTTAIDKIIAIDEQAVVQDVSSQHISEFLSLVKAKQNKISIWDCCAASGGKSILAVDTLNDVQLTVSDIRPSIIKNLQERFQRAGIKNYRSFIADLTQALPSKNKFQLIICDAPCTGSGTWGRTPEHLYFFNKKTIEEYTSLQEKIVLNAAKQLEDDGYFLYITCSVFKQENESMTQFIEKNLHLESIKSELIKGYTQKADTMFAALFKKQH